MTLFRLATCLVFLLFMLVPTQAIVFAKDAVKTSSAKSITPEVSTNGIVWQKDLSQAKALARKSKLPILVDFSADWCGWCHKLDRDCFQNPTIQRQIKNKAVFLKMNIEASSENKKTYDQTGATALPLVMIYSLSAHDKLQEKGRIESYLPPERFLAKVTNYL